MSRAPKAHDGIEPGSARLGVHVTPTAERPAVAAALPRNTTSLPAGSSSQRDTPYTSSANAVVCMGPHTTLAATLPTVNPDVNPSPWPGLATLIAWIEYAH